jgi:3-dehydroquinate dehydratase
LTKLSNLPRPFICAVLAEDSIEKCVNLVDRLESRVDAFEMNLSPFDERSFSRIKDVFHSTKRPCISTNRRYDFMKLYGLNVKPTSDEIRVHRLLKSLEAGSSAIDYELDTFGEKAEKPRYGSPREIRYARDPRSNPTEVTTDPLAVKKQKLLSAEAKGMGGEVVISCHAQTVIDSKQVVRIGKMMERRDADFAKLVFYTFTDYDLVELFCSVLKLKKAFEMPFNLMNVGFQPNFGRLVSAKLGSAWIYCRPHKSSGYLGQPTIEDARHFLKSF